MSSFLKQHYGHTEGPLGFPMLDRQARVLDGVLRGLPRDDGFGYRKAIIEKATTELSPGERAAGNGGLDPPILLDRAAGQQIEGGYLDPFRPALLGEETRQRRQIKWRQRRGRHRLR